MPAPHLAFASSAVSNPSSTSSHAAAHSSHSTATGPLPLFPPASAPIAVSNAIPNAILDSNSHSHPHPHPHLQAYYNSYSYNAPSDRASTTAPGTGTAPGQARIISAFASPAPASPLNTFTDADAHPLSFRQRTTPSTPFSAASLPRTSSLLPPARVIAKTIPITNGNGNGNGSGSGNSDRTAASTSSTTVAPYGALDAPNTITPSSSKHRPSRSNSVGGVAPDPARLPNRWSASTVASSRASIAGSHQLYHRHQRSASFSRRLSVDSLGSPLRLRFSQFEPTASPTVSPQQPTPRKLQKSRTGTSSNGGSPLRERGSPLRERGSPSANGRGAPRAPRQLSPIRALAPFTSLPPIIALPSLEQEVQGGTASFSVSVSGRQQRPPHVRQLSSEDNLQAFYLGDAQAGRQDHYQQPSTIYTNPTTTTSTTTPTMYSRDHPEAVPSSRGYTRSRSQPANGSTDSTKSNKDRSSKPPSQKAMLSRALQKANTAVQLDNAGNIEGAREAYGEACGLLQQVLLKTPGEEDKRKLEAIVRYNPPEHTHLDLECSTNRPIIYRK